MGPLQRQAFRKVYGKILDLITAKVFTEGVLSLAQYYDQPLRCFTFGDFQMVPTVEEFEEILGCPLGGRKPYLFSGFLPSLSKIAAVVRDSARELDRMKQTRNSVVGLPRKYLEGKARDMASQEKWVPFADILALLIFGVVLFLNVDGLVDLAAIDAFLAYHHSKESPVVAILADLFDTFDRRCEKNSARIVCCLPALCVWLVSHVFQQDIRHPCLLQSYRSCIEKRRVDWDQHLAGIRGSTINWFPRWKEGKEGVLFSCGDYPNVPLIGTRGCINYNPALAIRQLGYPMRGAPTEESLSPFLVRDFGVKSLMVIQRVHKACRSSLRKDKELGGIRNGIIGGYHEWLRVHTRGLDWLPKLKVINEKNFEALEEDEEVQALKLELGKARLAKEKFKSAATNIRKECTKSKRSLAQQLEATEQSMLAIIGQYKEELNQSLTHEQKLVEDFAQAYAEKEARGRVIDALHQEVTMWMDRFALTLNAKAKAIAEVCTAPEEIHGLINYCQHMIDLMTHIIRNHLIFAEERIESGLRKGKFEYASNVSPNNNRRAPVVGTRKKEEDTHAITTAPTWMKAPQNDQNSYQHNPPNFSIRAGSSLPTQVKGPPATERTPAQHTTPATPRPTNNTTPGASYSNARCPPPRDDFSHIPMAYSELWPSLLENHLVVAIPGKVFQPPYPKWYNSDAKCAYHSGAPGHNIAPACRSNISWLSFQEEGPNVKTNPLVSHGGASINAIEKDGLSRAKRLKDVTTSRRFIYQSLQAACMVSRGGDKRDECLFHLGESHDMETCHAVEELLQRLMDWGQLEVSKGGREEPQICMQSEEKKVPPTHKALVICFTRKGTSSRPMYPPTAPKPTPFAYQSNKVVPWKYTPPAFGESVATEVDSLSAKVTNITGLSGVTRSGRVFAPPHSAEFPSKGKAPMIQEPTDVATPSKEVDPPVVKGAEKRESLQGKAVTLEEAHEFLRLIQQSEFKVVEQMNKTPARISLFELLINSEPHRALLIKVLNEAHVLRDGCKWRIGSRPTDRHSFPALNKRKTSLQGSPISFKFTEMAPRKLSSKRSRKEAAAVGTSAAPERVQLRDDKYTDFQEEIDHRHWTSLVTPMAKFDPDIVLEFYANAWPTEEGVRDHRSWVRGQWIPFDADALSQFLGYPLVLEDGQECEYSQRRNRADGFDEEAIAQLLCIPGQDFARTAAGRQVRIMRTNMTTLTKTWMTLLLSNILPSMPPTRHPLDPDKSNRTLGFPALITGLCQSFGVLVTPSKVIRPPITRAFIEKYCTPRQAQGGNPQAPDAPPPPPQAYPAGSFDTERYLRHLVRQQAANHRAYVQTHDCLYQLSLSLQSQGFASFPCPTPDQFRAEVTWPGDWFEAQAREAPAEALGDADEARMDEEMTDLLDLLGGSGAT
ncbi:hypothetical protein HKD37_15G043033 [Glycine soja]